MRNILPKLVSALLTCHPKGSLGSSYGEFRCKKVANHHLHVGPA
jgi:hypothetical protein